MLNSGSPVACPGQSPEASIVQREREEQLPSEEPLKRQLHTYIKRVAELETRVEELTIKSEVVESIMAARLYKYWIM